MLLIRSHRWTPKHRAGYKPRHNKSQRTMTDGAVMVALFGLMAIQLGIAIAFAGLAYS